MRCDMNLGFSLGSLNKIAAPIPFIALTNGAIVESKDLLIAKIYFNITEDRKWVDVYQKIMSIFKNQ